MKLVRTFQAITREEAQRADRLANWAKTPQERLAEVEFLRAQRYPGGIAPDFKELLNAHGAEYPLANQAIARAAADGGTKRGGQALTPGRLSFPVQKF